MATKPALDGNKVKFILNELDDRAADMQDQLLDLLEKMFTSGREPEMKLVLRALQNNSVALRITTLLRSGRIQEAEDVVMGIKKA